MADNCKICGTGRYLVWEPESPKSGEDRSVRCKNCGTTGPSAKNGDAAVDLWNKSQTGSITETENSQPNMKKIIVAAASINQTPLDFDGNLRRILSVINDTEKDTAILCLPELATTGYGCEDAFFYADVLKKAELIVTEIGKYLKENRPKMLVAIGSPVLLNGAIYDACVLIWVDKTPQYLIIPKQNLCADGVHYEPRWFKPWPKGQQITLPCASINSSVKGVGDVILDWNGIKIGVEICEDAWTADRPGISLAERGVDIILNPSASHFSFGKDKIRERFVIEGSRAFNCVYIYANLLGNEAGRLVYDGDTIIASGGKLIAAGPTLSFKTSIITSAVVDLNENETKRIQNHSLKLNINRFNLVSANPGTLPSSKPIGWTSCTAIENKPPITIYRDYVEDDTEKAIQFGKAVSLGLFDYMRKSHSNGFTLSLSGGADSGAVAILVYLMAQYGINELGALGFIKRIGMPTELIAEVEANEKLGLISVFREIMTCVYQKTENSSPETEATAKDLAERLGFRFISWNVDDIVSLYEDKVEAALGRPLFWDTDDIALQNIQARVRSPGIWMIANIRNALLLSTSNRSEAAVGYATMDGDTSGGLAPIAGIDKAYLLKWLESLDIFSWLEPKDNPIKMILERKPTAELRPKEMLQSDESDLMPYDVLDLIEKAATRDKLSPIGVFSKVHDQIVCLGLSYTDEQLTGWVGKFFKLWAKNQWKRDRIAPAIHLDDENLDPKTWCRFPILSGVLK